MKSPVLKYVLCVPEIVLLF